MKTMSLAIMAIICSLSMLTGVHDSDIGVKMKYSVDGSTYLSHATHEEMIGNKWKFGDKEEAGYSAVIDSARETLSTCVKDIEDWRLDELVFRSDYQDGLWYWSVSFIECKPCDNKEPDVALLGVHLDGTSFHLSKE